jgi:O-antigen/teichoic acid export membrane protein
VDVLVYLTVGHWVEGSPFHAFLKYYPLVALFSLVMNITLYVLQAEQRFRDILTARLAFYLCFAAALLTAGQWRGFGLETVIGAHIAAHVATALLVIGLGWARLRLSFQATGAAIRQLLHFGKYCVVTNYGANLLKSSDTLIIGLMLTRQDVALYAVPLRIIAFVEIFLSGLADVALPKMAQAYRRGNNGRLVHIFYEYTGIATILLAPILAVVFLFPDVFIYVFAGQKYVDAGISAVVLQVFVAYGLLSAVERFTGVALIGMGRPDIDLAKVFVMVLVNAVGDALAIHYFQSLPAVALMTVLNVALGVVIGAYFINREVRLEGSRVLRHGWRSISRACTRIWA